MDKVEELFKEGFNLNGNVLLFPVRHHSPACSYHLSKVIKKYKPQVILIEGPRETEELIKHIVSEETVPPISIYYSFYDKKGEITKECGKYYCYYPFLNFSPEYVALKMGNELGIKTSFIDLSYGERLVAQGGEVSSKLIGSDKNITYSSYVEELCKNQGCRDFNEFWERNFEINGLYKETEDFSRELYTFSYFARESTSEEEMERDGTFVREKYMSSCILKEKGKKVLVVLGAFHIKGVLDLIKSKSNIEKKKNINSEYYLMPYSLKECNSLFGYASGMPYIGFYKDILESINKSNLGAYEGQVLNYIIKASRELRKEKYIVSTPDEIEAFKISKGLTTLRGKEEPGVYELLDGLRATFIKGEIGYGTTKFFDVIDKLLMGEGVGVVTKESDVPPLVKDFRERLKEYRLRADDYIQKEKILDIYKNPKHLEISQFFYACMFLELGFCELVKGPDILNGKDLNLIRATFKYRWALTAETKLIELSVNGGTIKEACKNIISDKVKGCKSTLEYTKNLIWCYNLGLLEELLVLLPSMEEIIIEDDDFLSLVSGLYNINYLLNLSGGEENSFSEVLKTSLNRCYIKICTLIPSLKDIKEEGEEEYIYGILDVYNFRNKSNEEGLLLLQLKELVSNCENESILGACYGILYGVSEIEESEVINKINVSSEFPRYLKGLSYTAKDLIFRNNGLLESLNKRIKLLEYENFLNVLPHLRLAFTEFTPIEKSRLGEKVSKILQNKVEVLDGDPISEENLKKIRRLEEETLILMKERWSFIE